MADGEISEVSEAIGQLRASVGALADQIGSLVQQWGAQDREAARGRREMYGKLNQLSAEFSLLKMTVEQMKPLVDAGHAAALRASGVRNLIKALWLLLVALAGAAGTALFNLFYGGVKPPHH